MRLRQTSLCCTLWISLILPGSKAFVSSPSVHVATFHRSRLAATTNNNNKNDITRQEIEQMRAEAAQRLEKLTRQLNELQQQQQQQPANAIVVPSPIATTATNNPNAVDVKEQQQKQQPKEKGEEAVPSPPRVLTLMENDKVASNPDGWKVLKDIEEEALIRRDVEEEEERKVYNELQRQQSFPQKKNLDLLRDTCWQVCFNIGRERGTWMAPAWGASGDRLFFHVAVEFTDEPLYERDDFFQGIAGTKVLEISNAWIIPRGVTADGSMTSGRRPVAVSAQGGYKVSRGQGPMGTDIVRFYIELLEDVRQNANSDVFCPAGRIYGTCGYFPIEPSNQKKQHVPLKEILAEEHRVALREYEELQREEDADTRLVSWDKMQRMKELMKRKTKVKTLAEQLQQARQRDPDRSQLRLSRNGLVGLSREGGVCCKVNKGFAVEYHIIGRMEIGAIDHREEHDVYDELAHKLHP